MPHYRARVIGATTGRTLTRSLVGRSSHVGDVDATVARCPARTAEATSVRACVRRRRQHDRIGRLALLIQPEPVAAARLLLRAGISNAPLGRGARRPGACRFRVTSSGKAASPEADPGSDVDLEPIARMGGCGRVAGAHPTASGDLVSSPHGARGGSPPGCRPAHGSGRQRSAGGLRDLSRPGR